MITSLPRIAIAARDFGSIVRTFRDALGSVFFVAIGLSLEPGVLLSHPGLVLASTAGLVAVKGIVTLVALRLAGAAWRVAIGSSLALAQVGEFSFVIAQIGSSLVRTNSS